MKYKVKVCASMEFEIEAEDGYSINGTATEFVENNRELFDWSFDEIKEIEK